MTALGDWPAKMPMHTPILTYPQLSTMLPVNQTLKYDCQHETKGSGKVWDFRDIACGIQCQKHIKHVHFAEHVKSCTRIEHTSPVNQTLKYD